MQTKICTKCGLVKEIVQFARSKTGKYGVRSACKECTSAYNAQYRSDNPDTVKAAVAKWRADNAEHVRRYNKKYYATHYTPVPKASNTPAKTKKERDKEYYIKNREAIIERATAWNIANPERSREHCRKTQERRRLTARGRLDDAMSSSVYQAIKDKKAGRKWEALVGYTAADLMAHLERQFHPGMTWDNYGRGGWHIDHIIPRSAFNYETPDDIDFKRCWALENLQPLWEFDNISKGAKLEQPFQPSLAIAA